LLAEIGAVGEHQRGSVVVGEWEILRQAHRL
jgi:hypothetical protein